MMIRTNGITKIYKAGDIEVPALSGIDLEIEQGEFVAIMGASGSGKSTLMNILGCLDYASQGEYFLDGVEVQKLSKNALADIRNNKIGFVFQGFNLLPRTSAMENVELPLLYDRKHSVKDPQRKAIEVLERLGLADRLHYDPSRLSGGQQQRVAIARALIMNPALILADEPTGNLDTKTSTEVMDILTNLNQQGITIIIVTHEGDIAKRVKRIIELQDGKILREKLN
jgi:putative ABC transport system ATP-binding protein